MKTIRTSKTKLILGAALLSMMAAQPAFAQQRSFDVPAQSATKSIPEFARQAGIQIIAPGSKLRGKRTPALHGNLDVRAALRQLLEGTGLRIASDDGATITLSASAGGNGQGRSGEVAKGRGSIEGVVTDDKTGRRLVGVLVKVLPGEQTATTDEQGFFRLTGVPAGRHQLNFSYIGRNEKVQLVDVANGEIASANIVFGSEEEIIVYGSRSAREIALNRERTAPNSTSVISSDLLGNFQGKTISEALRRAPGVSFQQDDATGDGTNIIVRGMSPDYNQVRLNGVTLPDTSGIGRSANLGNILADSVSEIKISKTLLPSQDSSGTGGLVEIETKSPLDRAKRYANFRVEGSRRGGEFGHDFLASGTLSGRFGKSGNFGLSAAIQYRKQDVTNYYYSLPTGSVLVGPYLPLSRFGMPMDLTDIDPRTPFPFEAGAAGLYPTGLNVNSQHVRAKTLGVNLAAEWQVGNATNLKLEYSRADRRSDNFNQTYILQGGAYFDYLPVSSLNGQVRSTLQDPLTSIGQTLDASVSNGEYQITDTVSFRGESKAGRFTFNYRAGYVTGRSGIPYSADTTVGMPFSAFDAPGLVSSNAIDPATGYVTTIFGARTGRGLPLPLFTPAGFALLNSPASTSFLQTAISVNRTGQNDAYSGGGDVRYDVGGFLDYVKMGGEFSRSHFENRLNDIVGYTGKRDLNGNLPTASAVGVTFENIDFADMSNTAGSLRFANPGSIYSLLGSLDQLVTSGLATRAVGSAGKLNGLTSTDETNFAGYLEGRVALGRIEAIGGVRVTHVRLGAAIATSADYISPIGLIDQALRLNSQVITNKTASQTDFLPRLLINYRPEENFVVRAGYYSTVARPQVALLSGAQGVTYFAGPFFGPNFNQPMLAVTQGNPDLRPAVTHNFDFGAEYYSGSIGVIKANVFYKRINNLLESTTTRLTDLSGVTLPDDPRFKNLPSNVFLQSTRPFNNPDVATIWGIEVAVERQFTFLPGVLSGFGVYANYTYSNSRKNEPRNWLYKPVYDSAGSIISYTDENYILKNVAFDQSPRHSGTASLTYNKFGIDAALTYSYQGRRKFVQGDYYLPIYDEAVDTLDFRSEYRFKLSGSDIRLYFEGKNLLKGVRDPDNQRTLGGVNGTPKVYTDGYFRGGRTLTIGLSAQF